MMMSLQCAGRGAKRNNDPDGNTIFLWSFPQK